VNLVILVLPLIVHLDNVDASTGLRLDESLQQNIAVDERKSHRKSTASAAAELLRGVRDSASAFGPLKSIARSLCFILDNFEVWPPSRTLDSRCLRSLI